MSKYKPLAAHLAKQKLSEFQLTFKQIENLIGASLPSSAARPQFWSNVTSPASTKTAPQRAAWLENSYRAFLISGADRVRFVKAE
jgi:hypothetical protein